MKQYFLILIFFLTSIEFLHAQEVDNILYDSRLERGSEYAARESIRLVAGSGVESHNDYVNRIGGNNSVARLWIDHSIVGSGLGGGSTANCEFPLPDYFPDGTEYEGFIPNEVSVGPSGTFNFSLPIIIPDGLGGVQPDIAIESSSNMFGIVGTRMGLKGTSHITKTEKTEFIDSESSFSILDQNTFALNGLRLIQDEVDPNKFRVLGSQESVVLRILTGSIAESQYYFEVKHSDGKVETFLPTVSKNGQNVCWSLDEVVDIFGNQMRYQYALKENFFPTLTSIKYNGHTSGTNFSSEIKFLYNEKESASVKKYWYEGIYHPNYFTQYLRKIKVENMNQKIHTYWFNYTNNACVTEPELASIDLETANGEFYPSIDLVREKPSFASDFVFTEKNEGHALNNTISNITKVPYMINQHDLNRDGFNDFMSIPIFSDHGGGNPADAYLTTVSGYDDQHESSQELHDLSPFIANGNPIPQYRTKGAIGIAEGIVRAAWFIMEVVAAKITAVTAGLDMAASNTAAFASSGITKNVVTEFAQSFTGNNTYEDYYDLVGFSIGRFTTRQSIFDYNNDGIEDIIYRDYLTEDENYFVSDVNFNLGVVNNDGTIDKPDNNKLTKDFSVLPVYKEGDCGLWGNNCAAINGYRPEVTEIVADIDKNGRSDLLVFYRGMGIQNREKHNGNYFYFSDDENTYFEMYVRFDDGTVLEQDVTHLIDSKFYNYETLITPEYIFLEDLDNNGKSELVWFSQAHSHIAGEDNHIAIEIDKDNQRFTRYTNSNLITGGALDVDISEMNLSAKGDFNADGVDDIIYFNRVAPNVQNNEGKISFGDASGNFYASEFNGIDEIAGLLWDLQHTYNGYQIASAPIQVADFDGNGYPDILLAYRDSYRSGYTGGGGVYSPKFLFKLKLFLNNGNGFEPGKEIFEVGENDFINYLSPGEEPNRYLDVFVDILDVNGDNRLDVYLQYKPNYEGAGNNLNHSYVRKLLLNNPKVLVNDDNFILPGQLSEVHSKNRSHFVDVKPSYAQKFAVNALGKYDVTTKNPVSGSVLSPEYFKKKVYNQQMVFAKTTVLPLQGGLFELLNKEHYRFTNPITHHTLGFLGYENSQSSELLINSKIYSNANDIVRADNQGDLKVSLDGSSFRYRNEDVQQIVSNFNKFTRTKPYNYRSKSSYSNSPFPLPAGDQQIVQISRTENFYDLDQGHITIPHETKTTWLKYRNGDDLPWSKEEQIDLLNIHGLPHKTTKKVNDIEVSAEEYFYQTPSFWDFPTLPERTVRELKSYDNRSGFGNKYFLSSYSYENDLLKAEKQYHGEDVNNANLIRTSSIIDRDGYGNVLSESIVYADEPNEPVVTSFAYSNNGRYLTHVNNTLGHTAKTKWDQKFGVPIKETNANGLSSSYYYDENGRLIKEVDFRGNITELVTEWGLNTFYPENRIHFKHRIKKDGEAPIESYENAFGQSVITKSKDITTDQDIYNGGKYDRFGMLINSYESSNDFIRANRLSGLVYDYRGELQKTKLYKDNSLISTIEEYHYADAQSKTMLNRRSDDKKNGHVQEANALGQNTSTYRYTNSAETKQVDRVYNSLGELEKITPPSGEPVLFSYDNRGYQTGMIDPDFGEIDYDYNNRGELKAQKFNSSTNEKNFTMLYDQLGRMTNQTISDNVETIEEIFEYDQDPKNLGTLSRVVSKYETQEYTYDEFSNLAETKTTINGSDYVSKFTYDNLNRPIGKEFESGVKLEYFYHSTKGHLEEIRYQGTTLWKLIDNNIKGQITEFSRGDANLLITKMSFDEIAYPDEYTTTDANGNALSSWKYTFDAQKGNLISRKNLVRFAETGTKERFGYTDFDQLEKAFVVNEHQNTEELYSSLTYDLSGNIKSKSDVADIWEYGNNAGPHAVTQLKGVKSIIPFANSDISYNALNQPRYISAEDGSYNYTVHYGIDGQRVHMTSTIPWQEAGRTVVDKVFFDNEEWITTTSGERLFTHYVYAGNQLVAILQGEEGDQETSIYYPVTDYLGSIIAIYDEGANLVQKRSYDAWGRPRNPDNWDDFENIEFLVTNRGFTMHEHMLNAGLINMNGRIYDPVIGRMLSPDNYVQDMSNPQNYNRYTYVLNNPLKYVDPSGELIEDWETIYKDEVSGDEVEVRDGIDKTIVVNESDFDKAKFFANEVNQNLAVSQEVADAYYDFYDKNNNYNEFSLEAVYDYFFNEPYLFTNTPKGGAGTLEFLGGARIFNAAKRGNFGQKLFLSEKFGVTSTRFGSSAANAQGALNQGGGLFKAGWSTGTNSAGQWGYKFRIGIGSSSANPNIARFHMYVPRSFVPNSFANPSIQLKRSLFDLGLKP